MTLYHLGKLNKSIFLYELLIHNWDKDGRFVYRSKPPVMTVKGFAVCRLRPFRILPESELQVQSGPHWCWLWAFVR